MPYRKLGVVREPRSRYIPLFCADILEALGPTFDPDIARFCKSLGSERERLSNLFFERTLQVTDPKLDSNEQLKFKFMVVLLDFLNMIGVIDVSPSKFKYVVDPVLPADELIDLMLGTRMPTFKASDLSGEWATIGNLGAFLPEVIRRNALILNERRFMATRFRLWLGSIGFKLMTQSSESLSQAERSFLVIYGCTKKRTKGFMLGFDSTPIPPIENKDPLVMEVGALAVATCLAGPCLNHYKLISNTILEQLAFYYGPHVTDLKTSVGYMQNKGPFMAFIVSPEDTIPWLLESQLTGLTAQAANISVRPTNQPPFTIRVPLPIMYRNEGGTIAAYPDLPEFHLYLTDQRDISRFWWDYLSKWRGRRISSLNDGGTMDYALCDLAVQTKVAGNVQIEMADLSGVGLCWLDESAAALVVDYSGNIMEKYLLPGPPGKGLQWFDINMAAYYARFGSTELRPAFAEFLELPMAWFRQPAERVIDYVCSVQGLTLQERVRYADVISLNHNCARYERLTKQKAPLDQMRYVKALLNIR